MAPAHNPQTLNRNWGEEFIEKEKKEEKENKVRQVIASTLQMNSNYFPFKEQLAENWGTCNELVIQ